MGRSRKARGAAPGGGPPARPASSSPPRPLTAAPARDGRPGTRSFALTAPAALALILCAALILQFPALRTPFFADDYLFLDQAAHGSLIRTLAAPDPIGNFYRPVGRQLYFWLVARAGPGAALLSHAANLALWLAVLALLFAVTRRLAGARAGLIAAGLLALHYAADVPVCWASGSQDLIAVVGALGALWLHLSGRRLTAGLALLVALLAKEVVALTPLVAVIAARGEGEPWRSAARRAWPLASAVAVWALIAWGASHARVAAGEHLGVTPVAAAAALAHLLQVVCGIEWYAKVESQISRPAAWIAALGLVLVALAPGARRTAAPVPRDREAAAGGATIGIVWALAGAVPVAAVAGIWSAYYYLFALCGAALALGTWLAAVPQGWALVPVAILAWNSAHASALPRHALLREPWTTCSHVNRSYIERGTRLVDHYLGQLKAARPSLPPRSTLFFAGLPGAVAFQTTDGPLVRWVYRDTSLRSYYLSSFDRAKARRGPYFFFEVKGDSLLETSGLPDRFYRIALGAILSDRPATAREMLWAEQDRDSAATRANYWLAWIHWDLGERERALALLRAAGFNPAAGPAPGIADAMAALARRDSVAAWRFAQRATAEHVLDAEAHGLLADLGFIVMQLEAEPVIDAYAARLLDPTSAEAWRRWAFVQIKQNRPLEGAESLRRYFDLAGPEAARDPMAQRAAEYLRTKYPITRPMLEPRPAAP